MNRANEIGSVFNEKFSGLPLKYKEVGEVRSLGAMCAMEFVKDQITKEPNKEIVQEILEKAHKRGLIIMSAGLYGNIIRLLTPLVTTDEQLTEGLGVLEEVIGECCT